MFSDKILYDKQIELYVKNVSIKTVRIECFFNYAVYCSKTTLQASEIVDKILCWILFIAVFILLDFWRGEAGTAIRFFGHPFEVVARISDLC